MQIADGDADRQWSGRNRSPCFEKGNAVNKETLGGKVEWVRMGGQKVVAGGSLSYAIMREGDRPAIAGSKGLYFSEKGAGPKPICIRASSVVDLKIALRSSDINFIVDGELLSAKMERSFQIYAALTPLVNVKMCDIHDVSSTIFKNIAMFPLGVFGPNIGDVLGPTAGFIQELVSGAFDFKEAMETSREGVKGAFADKGKKSGKIGMIVHIYPMKNSIATGRQIISAQDLAKLFF